MNDLHSLRSLARSGSSDYALPQKQLYYYFIAMATATNSYGLLFQEWQLFSTRLASLYHNVVHRPIQLSLCFFALVWPLHPSPNFGSDKPDDPSLMSLSTLVFWKQLPADSGETTCSEVNELWHQNNQLKEAKKLRRATVVIFSDCVITNHPYNIKYYHLLCLEFKRGEVLTFIGV